MQTINQTYAQSKHDSERSLAKKAKDKTLAPWPQDMPPWPSFNYQTLFL
jgi:hypothetical protein